MDGVTVHGAAEADNPPGSRTPSRRWATAAGVGAEHYVTKTAMDADLSQPGWHHRRDLLRPDRRNNFRRLVLERAGQCVGAGVDRIGTWRRGSRRPTPPLTHLLSDRLPDRSHG